MTMQQAFLYFLFCLCLVLCSCERQQGEVPFRLLTGEQTGLAFENRLEATEGFNVFDYMYFYNGGGVAAGDFNRDSLIDLYFTSNMGPNGLFLNRGNLQFEEVTQEAGVAGGSAWSSGVSVVDINQDGLLDIYVSQVSNLGPFEGANQLFICQEIVDGIPRYEEQAAAYGLDFRGFGTQASFFDYDLDGDLDVFQLNHSLHQNGTFDRRDKFVGTRDTAAGDRLLRNDGNGQFTDVTDSAGIISTVLGYGLGVTTGDINLDGWPDIYIGNDFHENDYLYINQQDGTFRETLSEHMGHTSRFSMGVDMADLNNDAHSEVISLDMLPADPVILKSSLGEDPYDIYSYKLKFGYHDQFARNNLQLNNQNGTFSEIGLYAGVAATDWSWAALLFDFENDGRKDLFISNGIPRRMNDIDYINFRADEVAGRKGEGSKPELAIEETMPQIELPNTFYRNRGDLRFDNWTNRIDNAQPSYSNGAVYADLDNDGDLDIVTNNLYAAPFIYENLAELSAASERHYLQFDFEGPAGNRNGIGTSVLVYKGTERLFYQHFPVRGYQSALAPGLHVGIGDTASVDSILIIWPDQSYQLLGQRPYDERHLLRWQEGLPTFDYERLHRRPEPPYPIVDLSDALPLDVVHEENEGFIEFLREPLIPHMVSREGPALAVADANGDGLEDFFLGGAKRQTGRVYLQTPDERFVALPQAALSQDSMYEDVDAAWTDVDQDGDADLIVASGGNEFRGQDTYMRPRLYLNDGTGQLTRDTSAFAGAYLTASCVLVADMNGNGLPDVFFGGRAVPWNYGEVPRSFLFQNQGQGRFKDITEEWSAELRQAGLVTDGQWTDIDQDGDPDLILAAEWSPLQIYRNETGRFQRQLLDDRSGWWKMVYAADFDLDGDTDILAGNIGENNKLQPTAEQPIRMYVNDFDENGQIEQILTYYLDGREVPFASYAELTKQLVQLKKRYLYARDFAEASIEELFGKDKLAESSRLTVNTLSSFYYENLGNGQFRAHVLPPELQFSTLKAAAEIGRTNVTSSKTELLVGGNFYPNNIEMGRYDASYGHLLQIGPGGLLHTAPVGQVVLSGEVRAIQPIRIGEIPCYLIAKNAAALQIVQIGSIPRPSIQ